MQRFPALRCRTSIGFFAIAWGLLACSPAARAQPGSGDDSPTNPLAGVDIVKIEEDWLLDIADPDPAADCPQVVTVFGPADPSWGTHAVYELNHGTLPEFGEGGMQLQAWYGDFLIGYRGQFAPAEFNHAIEQVKYTTAIRIYDHTLKLYVKNGQSVTWGSFGGTWTLRIEMETWRDNLNDWNPAHSIAHSRVSYGANRVNKYVRTAVRYYTADQYGHSQLHYTDDTDTYIHRLVEDHVAPPPLGQ